MHALIFLTFEFCTTTWRFKCYIYKAKAIQTISIHIMTILGNYTDKQMETQRKLTWDIVY